jgi:hypothetical protein
MKKLEVFGKEFGSYEDNFLKWRRSKGRMMAPMVASLLKERVLCKMNNRSEDDFLRWKRSWSIFLLGTWVQFLMFMKNNYIRKRKRLKRILMNYLLIQAEEG